MIDQKDKAQHLALSWLLSRARDPQDEDIRALACILTKRCSDQKAGFRQSLGLDADELHLLLSRMFRMENSGWKRGKCLRDYILAQYDLSDSCCRGNNSRNEIKARFTASLLEQEEADLCRLFLNHSSATGVWPVVFARLIARACMEPEHLWMSLGLENRDQLTGILERHFPALVAKNDRDMRWKKFFYKLLCDVEKVWNCTASSCEICPHHIECYAPET